VNTIRGVSRLIFFFFIVTLAFAARASEKIPLLKVAGRTYTNVTVIGFNATDLYFKYDGGFSNVRLKYLSDDLKQKFFFDAERSSRAEAEQAAQDAQFSQALAKVDLEVHERMKAATSGPPVEAEIIDPFGKNSFIGQPAPALKSETWLTDKPEPEDKFQLVFIWSSTSTACQRVIPKLNQLAKTFTNMVTTAISTEPKQVLEEAPKPKIEFFSASEPTGKFAKDLGVTTIPCVVLIDPKKIIRYVGHPGALDTAIINALFVKYGEKR
jgi:thiol-disulfide isomerase/thioredoxin